MTRVTPGSVILVTGATGAIGFEIAAQAAEGGAIVGVHGSTPESVARAIERLRTRIPEARLIAAPGDFKEPGSVDAVVGAVVQEGRRLDALIHCAVTGAGDAGDASTITGPFAGTTPDFYAKHAALILGVFQRLCFVAHPHLAREGGALIAFVSDAGRFAAPRQSIVGAAFGGLMAFVRNLALELARDGIRVHCISLSFVQNTPIFDAHAARAGSALDRAGLGLPTPADISR